MVERILLCGEGACGERDTGTGVSYLMVSHELVPHSSLNFTSSR